MIERMIVDATMTDGRSMGFEIRRSPRSEGVTLAEIIAALQRLEQGLVDAPSPFVLSQLGAPKR